MKDYEKTCLKNMEESDGGKTCCVADQFCTAAANFQFPNAKRECFACGQPVCSKCSSKRLYRGYGRVVLCSNCQVVEDGNDKVVMRRLFRMAGY